MAGFPVGAAAVAANAVCTGMASVALVPGLVLYPLAAQAVSGGRSPATVGAVAVDAGLCFGPLLVPALLALGAIGLRSAYVRDPRAAALNARAVAAWLAAIGVGWLLVTAV